MLFCFVACDTGDDPNPNKDNPGTSQGGESNSGGETNNGDGEGTNGGEEMASDEIMVKSISSGYDTDEGYAYVVISFARPNGEKITFAHPDDSAITLVDTYVLSDGFDCFSITDGFEVIGVTVSEKSVTVDYAATYEEFNQITPSITSPTMKPRRWCKGSSPCAPPAKDPIRSPVSFARIRC